MHAFPVPTFSSRAARLESDALDRWALARIQRLVAGARIRFVLWDGYELVPARPAVATVTFRNKRALFGWLWNPELNFGEAYMFGAVDIDGDLIAMLEDIYRELPESRQRSWRFWPESNDLDASRSNVHRHYDLGNDFYRLWLDSEMLYTCAYFPEPSVSLEAAQIAKMDLVCRKLALRPGERVVEAGCGWGSLALFMARACGVTVRAFNISTEQIEYARERAAAEGLTGRVEFVEDDYRNISGRYDVFVSVGMLEHVGLSNYPALASVIDRALTPTGRGLLHFIGRDRHADLNTWIRKRIFPGAYPPTLRELCELILEPDSMAVLDVENLRLHYARTLDHWYARFNASVDSVTRMFDEIFVRAWRLYLAGSRAAFSTGSMQLFQVVFARASSNDIPWTRAIAPTASFDQTQH